MLGTKSDLEFSEDRTINMAWDAIWYTAGNVARENLASSAQLPLGRGKTSCLAKYRLWCTLNCDLWQRENP